MAGYHGKRTSGLMNMKTILYFHDLILPRGMRNVFHVMASCL